MKQPFAPISNDYRTTSMSDPATELEAIKKLGGGHDPLAILLHLERRYGTVLDEDLEAPIDMDNPFDDCEEHDELSLDECSDAGDYFTKEESLDQENT